jgi:DNA-binding NarL/FixJ family response regulator
MIESPSERRRRVFLVDDHPLVREGLRKVIDREPDLEVCGDAEEAGPAFSEICRLKPDIAVIDLTLRGESGLDLIKRLGAEAKPPRILVLSMHDEASYAERSLRAGALSYVMKRESSGKVLEAIRQVLAGHVYVSEAVALGFAEKVVGNRRTAGGSVAEQLSDRELEVFRRIGLGQENRLIAEELHLSLKTVQTHCAHIKEKLGVRNSTELTREAVRWLEQERQA